MRYIFSWRLVRARQALPSSLHKVANLYKQRRKAHNVQRKHIVLDVCKYIYKVNKIFRKHTFAIILEKTKKIMQSVHVHVRKREWQPRHVFYLCFIIVTILKSLTYTVYLLNVTSALIFGRAYFRGEGGGYFQVKICVTKMLGFLFGRNIATHDVSNAKHGDMKLKVSPAVFQQTLQATGSSLQQELIIAEKLCLYLRIHCKLI